MSAMGRKKFRPFLPHSNGTSNLPTPDVALAVLGREVGRSGDSRDEKQSSPLLCRAAPTNVRPHFRSGCNSKMASKVVLSSSLYSRLVA